MSEAKFEIKIRSRYYSLKMSLRAAHNMNNQALEKEITHNNMLTLHTIRVHSL